jgi:glucosamine--fructose-6-phosphate aminotransferase (isomerizing)
MSPRLETHCLRDILRQPGELRKCLDTTLGTGRASFDRAAAILRDASDIYIAGIGASWSAGMAALAFFSRAGRAASLVDASELLHQTVFRPGSAILLLSRSGKSIEVVSLLDRAAKAGARVIGVTNGPDSPLAVRADAALLLGVGFDHAISVVTYSTVALVGGLVSAAATGTLTTGSIQALHHSLEALPGAIATWREQLSGNGWFTTDGVTYFLARQASQASAHEARLMWEEAAKVPASALSTGGFRHGPQEIVVPGLRVGLWIDAAVRREEDFALARDLRRLGARVLMIGQKVPQDAGDLVFELPPIPPAWQFMTDIVPVQLAAEHLSGLRGVDCDTFRLSSHVVTAEGGLLL